VSQQPPAGIDPPPESLPQPSPPPPPVRWGMGDAAVGWLIGFFFSQVASVVILLSLGYLGDDGTTVDDVPLTVLALLQIPLWAGYLGVPWYASATKGNGMVRDFGLRMKAIDVPLGLGVGIATQVGIALIYAPIADALGIEDVGEAAQELSDKATDPVGVVLFLLIVVVGAPIIEEIFFRGLVLRSIEHRFGSLAAVLISGSIFGLIHFQWADALPLIAVGIVLGALTVKTGRLGPAIWAHAFFNGTSALVLLLA
jgi:membrane protease YdiL (CAAX protease family)